MTVPEAWPRFSVIVASRGRPDHLRRALRAIRQLDYPSFEIVVVGDPEAISVAREGDANGVKQVAFDTPNLSAARNLGIAQAAGEFCAFLDDDAVPEPMWLRRHAEALEQTGADAAVGYVRGPDGIRFQSCFDTIGQDAGTRAMPAEGDGPFMPRVAGGRAVKLVGTNMVIRRDVLMRLGGFDPSFSYYLDDGDLSIRLAKAGYRAAVVPHAEVHHALAVSPRRTSGRAIRSLHDIGRSTAIFLRRHLNGDPGAAFPDIAARERRRLVTQMVLGRIEPRDVGRLMATLDEGWAEGMAADLPVLPDLSAREIGFQAVVPHRPGHAVTSCRLFGRGAALARARRAVTSGPGRASVICLAVTGLPHTVRYTEDGVWLQIGGQFVSSGATGKRWRWCRFADRIDEEIRRVAKSRGLNESGSVSGEG